VIQAGLLLIGSRLQKPVQLFQVAHPWHGDKVIAPKLAAFALDAALLVAFAGVQNSA